MIDESFQTFKIPSFFILSEEMHLKYILKKKTFFVPKYLDGTTAKISAFWGKRKVLRKVDQKQNAFSKPHQYHVLQISTFLDGIIRVIIIW